MPSYAQFDVWQSVTGVNRGTVLQIQSYTYADTVTYATSSYVNSPLVVTITPYYATSKIYVTANIMATMYGLTQQFRLTRNDIPISQGNLRSSTTQSTVGWLCPSTDANHQACPTTMWFLDSPASASLLTYRVQVKMQSANTMYINRSGNDADNGDWSHRSTSVITVMEIAQ
jgi:hypothetical protein